MKMLKLLITITTSAVLFALTMPCRTKAQEAKSINELINELYPDGLPYEAKLPYPLELSLEPNPIPNSAGATNLQLTIVSSSGCESYTVSISGIDNLIYNGESLWTLNTTAGETTKIDISIVIPENDTSGISFTAKCTDWFDYSLAAYFVTGPERVKFYKASPRKLRKSPKTTIDMSDPPVGTGGGR